MGSVRVTNPALGAATDLLVQNGGTAILSETPEIYGAEHLLTRRAVSREVGDKLIGRIRWWEEFCARNNAEMNNNPSAGNKAGGPDDSSGKVARRRHQGRHDEPGGRLRVRRTGAAKGFVFMGTPGYDPVTVTGQVAGGANLICFTTGRGSAFGFMPTPSLKLATDTTLWNRQQEDIDINCGGIIDGTEAMRRSVARFSR